MRWLAVTAVCIAASSIAHAQPAVVLTGRVLDRGTREPVVGAIVSAGGELVVSDETGAFALSLPPGVYTLDVTADWLEPSTRRVELGPSTGALEILVDAAAAASGEQIEVIGVAPRELGETKIDAAFARTVPGGGDAAKVVQSLPAVARPPAGSAEVVVWGAAPNDTRVFVDGVPVSRLYHLGGYRAAVGNDLVGDIRLAPAAFGPDRGRAIGGAIDIGLADPASLPGWRAQADLLDGSLAGSVTAGRFAIAAAARRSWLEQAVDLAVDPETLAPNAPLPEWSDAQIAARVRIDDRITLTSWVIGSTDRLERRLVSDDPGTQTDEQVDQWSVRGQVAVRRERDSGFDSAMLWIGSDRDDDAFQFGTITAARRARTWVGGGRAVQRSRLAENIALTVGGDVDAEQGQLERTGSLSIPSREGDVHIFGQPPGDDVAADRWKATTIDAALHASVDLAWNRISSSLGARVDSWMLSSSRLTPRIGATPGIGSQQILFDADPRGTVQVRISDEVTARAAGGRYHQARAVGDASAVFGTPDLGLEEAWHATLGSQWSRSAIAIEGALYARWLSNLVARDLAVTPPLARSLTQQGSGDVVGVQITARLIGWHGLSGWVSYNLSRSRRQDSAMQAERFFDHDQTHGLITVAGWEHGGWALGGRVRVASGEPRTDVTGSFFDSRSGRFQPLKGTQNGVRLPIYFAGDVRAERRFVLGPVRIGVYAEVQNVTNRANPEEIIYSADFSERGYLTGLPLLAMLGVRVEQ